MDEGVIYEEGPPEQLFGDPRRPRTRAFINRIRSYQCHIASRDFDFYAMNGEIEAFCEKQFIPRKGRDDLLALVEEVVQLHAPQLASAALELSIDYSEKTGSLQLLVKSAGEARNLLEGSQEEEDIGLLLIRNLCEATEYGYVDGNNRLAFTLRRR
jgi:polar amino acid transport system ATP-binding protein